VTHHGDMTELAMRFSHGDQAGLHDAECPVCGRRRLVFSFTVGAPPRYGLFIECGACGHRQHFNLLSRPPNFREEQVLPKYQRLEDEAIRCASSTPSRRSRRGKES
jgi:DNA-directed RNA polymerase subunit RPC12/RpoP